MYDCPWEKCVLVVVLKSCDLSVCYIGSTCTCIVQSINYFTFPAPFSLNNVCMNGKFSPCSLTEMLIHFGPGFSLMSP